MALTTLFLVVLIVSLLIGNAILFFLKRPDSSAVQRGSENSEMFLQDSAVPNSEGRVFSVERKVDLAHRRLQELELKPFPVSKVDFELLKRKIEKLDNFKATAESEIIALKEIVVEMKENGNNKNAKKAALKLKGEDISEKEMRKLIFRSAATN